MYQNHINILKKSKIKGILNCRLVCKELKSERDQHQQNSTAKINKFFCTVGELKKHVSDDHEKDRGRNRGNTFLTG